MLKKEINYIAAFLALLCFTSCSTTDSNKKFSTETKLLEISQTIIGKEEYLQIYDKLNDSLRNWSTNKLGYYQFCGSSKNCFFDSLLCFNKSGDRFVTAKLMQQLLKEGTADDIDFVFGEKIKSQWYFFSGANIFIPREMVEGHDIHKPLSYQQLHKISLKEVYSGYLNDKGEINEAWFTSQFEGQGWGDFEHQEKSDWILKGKRFKSKKEFYKFLHLEKVKNNWASRDTTKPIIHLP